METFSIAEAAEATGLTKKALRNRVDRGQLRSVLRAGVRRIPRSELERAGLMGQDQEAGPEAVEAGSGGNLGQGASALEAVIDRLHERLEEQAAEIGRLRLLTEQAESLKLAELQAERQSREAIERALHEARMEASTAEAARQAQETELLELRAELEQARIACQAAEERPTRRWWPFRRTASAA